MPEIFSVKIGGQAGQGIKAAGLVLAKVATRSGYFTYDYTEFPSLIRGGHNIIQVCISKEELTSVIRRTDLLIALNQDTIDRHYQELGANACLIYDGDKSIDTSKVDQKVLLFSVPLSKLAGGNELMSNTVALGSTLALTGGDIETLKQLIREEFAHKDEQVVSANLNAAQGGYDFIKNSFQDKITKALEPLPEIQPKMVLGGNEACALGAIAGGVQFAAIYPMSPITNILHVLSAFKEKYGYVYKQPEDEISAINLAIGAAFAGARSMTATSGGGFCLMTEAYGLAAMSETPLIIIEGMRPGPATGLPTWSGQGDLRLVLHGHQGDFPHIVLAPGDAKEAFEMTMRAFNLAEKYQLPVVVLIDKNICENDISYPVFDISGFQLERGKLSFESQGPEYKRYALSEDGISLRTVPGTGNYLIGSSYQHTETGNDTEDIGEILPQIEKFKKKMKTVEENEMSEATALFGPQEAEATIVSWGSNKGAILRALKELPNVNFLQIKWLHPFPSEEVGAVLSKAKRIINVESNVSGQLAGLINEKTGIRINDMLLKYDGRPIFPDEITEKIRSVLSPVFVSI